MKWGPNFKLIVVTLTILYLEAYSASVNDVVFTLQQTKFTNGGPITYSNFSHVGIEGLAHSPVFFTVHLSNTSPDTISGLTIRVILSVNSKFHTAGFERVFQATSNTFFIEPVITGGALILTSNEFFDRNGSHRARGRNIETIEISKIKQAAEIIMNSGSIPSGKAQVKVELFDNTNSQIGTVEYEVFNVNQISLHMPGAPYGGSDKNVPVLYSAYPQFSWTSDLSGVTYQGALDNKYEIEIFKKDAWMNSIDEIVHSKPLFAQKLKVAFLQYPISGVQPLEPGKVYCWRVKGLLKAPATQGYDDSKLVSEVYAFSIADLSKTKSATSEINETIGLLQAILGPDYFYLLDDLKGYKAGQFFTINDQHRNLLQLREMVKDVKNDKVRVRTARLFNK